MNVVDAQLVTLLGEPESSGDSRFGPEPAPAPFWARLCAQGCDRRVVFVLAHPSADFTQHPLLRLLQMRGFAALGTTTRFVGNDSNLTMERSIQDLGKAIRFLKELCYERIVLVGHSGGASLMAFYQAEAQQPSVSSMPDGTPFQFGPDDLPAADAVALLAPHPSRASILTEWLDPSVIVENDPYGCDPELDMFNPKIGPPYSQDWLSLYRQRQRERSRRISEAAKASLRWLSEYSPNGVAVRDELLIVHRTGADPRFLDISVDPNGREAQVREISQALNYSHSNMARVSSLRSWLSQWSLDYTQADGPGCMRRTSIPVLVMPFGADQIVFPSQTDQYIQAVGDRGSAVVLQGATHFLRGQGGLLEELANQLVTWVKATVA